MKQYILVCPECHNIEDFRKEVKNIVAITRISPIVEDNYFEDISDSDIYPYPDELSETIEIYCNKCEFCLHYDSPDCNDEEVIIKHFIKQGWLKETGE